MRASIVALAMITCALSGTPRASVANRTADTIPGAAVPQIRFLAAPLGPSFSGGATVSVGGTIVTGESRDNYMSSGMTGSRELCTVSGGDQTSGEDARPPSGAIVAWRFESRLKSFDRSGAVVDLHWTRTVHDRASVDGDSMDRHYELSLHEGARVPIDLVRATGGPHNGCDGVALEAELSFWDEPELANRLLEYRHLAGPHRCGRPTNYGSRPAARVSGPRNRIHLSPTSISDRWLAGPRGTRVCQARWPSKGSPASGWPDRSRPWRVAYGAS